MIAESGSHAPVGNGTTERVLALLGCFGERDEWGVGELAARMALPKSTVHRLLGLCTGQGFIAPQGAGVYRVGTELSRVASQIVVRDPMVRAGSTVIDAIAHECQEVAILAASVPEKLSMTYQAKAEPSTDFRYNVELHTLLSLCWGACGRTILAHLPAPLAAQAIAAGKPSPSGSPFSAATLRADLEAIRARGYCISHGQHKLTAVGVAVPFFGAGGAVRGSLGISVPTFRFRNRMVKPLVAALSAGARELTYLLGGEGGAG